MLLTITNTRAPATDLGYLLHKHPDRHHVCELPCGRAHVFYPEAAAERCTAALLLDLDPIGLVRGREGSPAGGLGKRVIHTRLRGAVTIREENSRAALEVMSRWAVRPEWLIYLPPTMSPPETTHEPGLLEHPTEAFAYYRDRGVGEVVCEQKHMGSRAVVVVCREEPVVAERFGISGEGVGICYTRTGRRFFEDRVLEAAFLSRVRSALDTAGLWEELDTNWVCLDCEVMPWSAKAQDLLRSQYAAVGAASRAALADAIPLLREAAGRGVELGDLLERFEARAEMSNQFTQAYRRYCWPVRSLDDLKLAPFHLLASEGAVHADKDHLWHMGILSRVCAEDEGLLRPTPHLTLDVTDPSAVQAGVRWWEELTGSGEEGMVVKPRPFVATAAGRLLQPALKSRGREYLRLIYGPEYTAPEHLERLRRRGLAAKRSLAVREFALGLEALERFVQREPLHRVHECVFGVLALESEPVDPRL
jgi:protein phosphatase